MIYYWLRGVLKLDWVTPVELDVISLFDRILPDFIG